jgi:hypothetical protein
MDRNGLEKGDASSPLLLHFGTEQAIRKVQTNNKGLKLHSTHQLLLHSNKLHLLGDGVHSLLQTSS